MWDLGWALSTLLLVVFWAGLVWGQCHRPGRKEEGNSQKSWRPHFLSHLQSHDSFCLFYVLELKPMPISMSRRCGGLVWDQLSLSVWTSHTGVTRSHDEGGKIGMGRLSTQALGVKIHQRSSNPPNGLVNCFFVAVGLQLLQLFFWEGECWNIIVLGFNSLLGEHCYSEPPLQWN